MVIPGLVHRGPTHSLIVIFLFFLPVFMLYRERVAPYFVAVVLHSVPGDYITGQGIQLLWPLIPYWYGVGVKVMSLANIFIEWALFLMFMTVMFKTRDVWNLFQHHASNIFLFIPLTAVLLPTLLSFSFSVPVEIIVPHVIVPFELVIPHLIYIALFAFSVIIDFHYILRKFTRPVN